MKEITLDEAKETVQKTLGLMDRILSLKSEYDAYHVEGNDYWRGVKYALDSILKEN